MQTSDGGIKEKSRNDERARLFVRETRHHRQYPKQLRKNPDVQTGHGEKMERPGLLERLFDIFGTLAPQTERNSANKTLHVRRIVQTATKHAVQPET